MKTFIILLAAVLWLGTVGSFGQTSPTTEQKQQTSKTGTINGHEYVDLGLSVKWATCNVGASSPEDYGDYFAWGDTRTKKGTYIYYNCPTWEKDVDDIAGDPNYDAARAYWGSPWRMPTKDELDELKNKCEWIWIWASQGGHDGYKITGPNGNSIFLPAAGERSGPSRNHVGYWGFYWSSSPDESNTQRAYIFYFNPEERFSMYGSRIDGRSVRPVTK